MVADGGDAADDGYRLLAHDIEERPVADAGAGVRRGDVDEQEHEHHGAEPYPSRHAAPYRVCPRLNKLANSR